MDRHEIDMYLKESQNKQKCINESCDGIIKSKVHQICDVCILKKIRIPGSIISPEDYDRVLNAVESGKAFQEAQEKTILAPAGLFNLTPHYYGDGDVVDPYEYATIHKLSHPAMHANKYITRAGKKPGETYEQAMRKAIAAIERDIILHKKYKI